MSGQSKRCDARHAALQSAERMPNRVEEITSDSRGPDVARWQQGWRCVAVFGRLGGGKGGRRGVRGRCWGAAEADQETRMDGIPVATIQCIVYLVQELFHAPWSTGWVLCDSSTTHETRLLVKKW